MKVIGKLVDASKDFATGKLKLTFLLQNNINSLDEIANEEKLDIEVKKHRKKRSLDANAYCWVLIGEIAERIGATPVDVYRMAIKEIGPYEVLPIKNAALKMFTQAWSKNGVGWVCEVIGKSKLKGYTNIKAYYGSSTYDTKQMSRLIDTIVEDCKMLGINTDTPEQIARYKEEWK